MTQWERRDYRALRALVETDNDDVRSGYLGLSGGRQRGTLGLDLSDGEIHDSLLTLGEAGYVHFDRSLSSGAHATFTHLEVTGAGYQALGEWPFFTEVTPATLAEMLERFADEAPTEEEAGNARRAADYVRRLSGDAFKAAVKTIVVESAKAGVRLAVGP
jgi:hypothetical protein